MNLETLYFQDEPIISVSTNCILCGETIVLGEFGGHYDVPRICDDCKKLWTALKNSINNPPKTKTKSEIMERSRAINEARRARLEKEKHYDKT